MKLDEAYRILGSKGPLKMGWYHVCIHQILLYYNCVIIGFQLLGMIFIGHIPRKYHCTPPDGFSSNETTPEMDKCHMYEVHDGIITNNLTDCVHGWDYESSIGETSIVTDVSIPIK